MRDPRRVLLHLVPPALQQATTDPCLHQRLPDTHRQVWTVSCRVTALFSWVLVHKVLLCPPRVSSPVLGKFWQLYGGVNGDLLQEYLRHPLSNQNPSPGGRHISPQETLKHCSVSISAGPLDPGVHKVCLSPLSFSGGNGV